MGTIFTIGHSDHTLDSFLQLLLSRHITAIADVRSSPFSRIHPQFNRETLKSALRQAGIDYVFLGDALGARTADRSCYRNGLAEYDLIAKTDLFKEGLRRVLKGGQTFTVALMCAEKEPLDCHRTILVARNLVTLGERIEHILADGRAESHEETEQRLLRATGQDTGDLFSGDSLARAYEIRGREICYNENLAANQMQEKLA